MRSLLILWFSCFCLCSSVHGQIVTDSTNSKPVDSLLIKPKDSVVVNDKVASIIALAKTFLGTPYHWGGTTPSGFDCSGFINYIFGAFGFTLVRTSYNLAELGETVSINDVQPGDLLFFRGSSNTGGVGHVGMVIEVTPDAINFIHSSSSKGVTINNFKTSKYYISHYVKAKRLDYGVSKQVRKN